jgi:hypothetical protein
MRRCISVGVPENSGVPDKNSQGRGMITKVGQVVYIERRYRWWDSLQWIFGSDISRTPKHRPQQQRMTDKTVCINYAN